ncbi:MAG: transporter permease [Glaciihabitans sp.]|nr:transporter permease [Glaciihabitans sp.]
MFRFVLTRLVLLGIGLGIASILIFLTLRVLPGDVAQVIAGTQSSPERVAAIRDTLGLNQPLPVQYLEWIGNALHLDLGESLVTGTPVIEELTEKAEVTIPLGLMALLLGLLIGLPLGVVSAVRNARASGIIVSGAAQTLAAVPIVWAGLLGVVVFSLTLGLLPAQGFPRGGWEEPGRAIRSLVLPAVTIAVIEGAVLLRFVRSAVLEAIGQDYVRTAAAKGLTLNKALLRHGLPNVALGIISVLGIQVAGVVVGTVVVEQLFNLPGIGRMLVTDVGNRDLPKVQSELLMLTGLVLIVGFVVDLIHRMIDPRQREQSRE